MAGTASDEGPVALVTMLPRHAIRLQVQAADWREAVRASGDALLAGGSTTDAYTGEMIRTVEALGPYIVIAPGVALAHARPSPAVVRTGLSLVTLATPVAFGHRHNDPVWLVLGLAAVDDTGHVDALAVLAEFIADEARRQALREATDVGVVLDQIAAFAADTGGASSVPDGPPGGGGRAREERTVVSR